MNQIQITKTEDTRHGSGIVLDFEDSNFDIVSGFGFGYSDLGHDLLVSETGHSAKIVGGTFETTY